MDLLPSGEGEQPRSQSERPPAGRAGFTCQTIEA